MSQQDNPQANQDVPPVSDSGSWSTEPATNRPAEGATRVASLHQAEQTWRAGEGATDFLGLEQDTPIEAPLAAASAETSAPGAAPEVSPTQAWLFHMENDAQSAAHAPALAAPGAAQEAPEWSAEALLAGQDLETPLASVSNEAGALAPALESLPEGEPVLAGELQEAAPRRSRRTQWLVAASLVLCLGAAAGWQIWNSKAQHDAPSSNDPRGWVSTTPKPKPTSGTETPALVKNPTKPVKPDPQQHQQPPPQPDPKPPVEVAVALPPVVEPAVVPTTHETQPVEDPVVALAPDPSAATTSPEPASVPTPVDFTPVAFSGTRPGEVAAGVATPKGARRPDAAEVADLWIDAAIPFDAIAGSQVLRTPRVGAVRLLLKNGEHLQGRLHAVGQGQVSVDIALGRMSVDYSDVSEIVQILEADLSKKPSNGLPEETAGLLYISAKVPGGQLAGWLVQRADGKLTLITEEAKKITIDDDGFEPLSKGRARVVGTLGRDTLGSVQASTSGSVPAAPKPKSPVVAPKKPAAPKPTAKSLAKPKG